MLLGFIDSISINAISSSSFSAVSLVRLFSPPQHASDAAAPCVRRRALLSPPPRRTLPKRLEVRPHVKWVRRGTEHGSVVKFQDAMHDHGVIEEGLIEALKAFSASMSEDENLPSEFASAVPQTITVTPEENEAIQRLQDMGFDRDLVLEVFFACNKNEDLAANCLLDHQNEFED